MIVVNARFLTQKLTGVQRFAIEISLELKKILKENVQFVSPCNIEQKKYARILGAIVVGKHKGHIWEQWDLPKYLKDQKSPLLLCLCNTAPLFYKNKIVTVHDVAFMAYPQTFNKSFLYFYRFMIPRIMASAKKILTVSEFSKKEIIKYYNIDAGKIAVIHNAVTNDFRKIQDDTLQKEKYVLAVSSLNYRKNFIAVLRAFDALLKQKQDILLYIIGDLRNSNFSNINIDQYKDNTKIKFLGRVTDSELVRYYSNAFAFVYPSFYEGFGIPPLEAQSCGCPVICAKASCLPEIFGNSVSYCNPNDPASLAEAIKSLCNDEQLRSDLIERGLHNVDEYSWEKSANKIFMVIKSIK